MFIHYEAPVNIVSGGTTNDFYYDIGNIISKDFNKLSVELIDCAISKSYHTFAIGTTTENTYAPIPFYTTIIKVYINFNVSSNSIYNNNSNGLLMGLVPTNNVNVRLGTTDQMNEFYYTGLGSAKLESENKIKYYLKNIPSGIININIYNELNNVLLDYENNPPENVLLCLKFKYEF